jgi:hypothetical protein
MILLNRVLSLFFVVYASYSCRGEYLYVLFHPCQSFGCACLLVAASATLKDASYYFIYFLK